MKTVQMVLEEDLLARVDAAADKLGVNRSAFTRAALQEKLDALARAERERTDREGYERHPLTSVQDDEGRAWPADWADDAAWEAWRRE